MVGSREVRVLDAGDECPALPLVDGEGVARAVIWPGIGAELRSMHRIRLAPGARTIPQRHPMEAVYYVLSGGGSGARPRAPARAAARRRRHGATSSPAPPMCSRPAAQGIEILGGPCPADPALYAGLST